MSAGWSSEKVWRPEFLVGGDAGGEASCDFPGAGPAGQYGRCLFGIGAEPGRDVSRLSADVSGGGVKDALDAGW